MAKGKSKQAISGRLEERQSITMEKIKNGFRVSKWDSKSGQELKIYAMTKKEISSISAKLLGVSEESNMLE
jgi:hypothetical protein